MRVGSVHPITEDFDFFGFFEQFRRTKAVNISYHKFDNQSTYDYLTTNILYDDLSKHYIKAEHSEFVALVAVLPNEPTTNRKSFFFLPFHRAVWLTIILGILYFSSILYMLTYETVDCGRCFLATLSWTLQKPSAVKFPRKIFFVALVYISYSFLINTLHSMYLGSFLIKTSEKPQADVLCQYIVFNTFVHFKSDILKRHNFTSITNEQHSMHFNELNMTYGYCMDSAYYHSFNNFQKHLEKPLFLKDDSDYTEPCTYSMHKDFVLKDLVNRFMRELYYSGLFGKLLISSLTRKFIGALVENSKAGGEDSKFLRMDDFEILSKAFCCFLGAAVMIFVIEISYFKIMKKVFNN